MQVIYYYDNALLPSFSETRQNLLQIIEKSTEFTRYCPSKSNDFSSFFIDNTEKGR